MQHEANHSHHHVREHSTLRTARIIPLDHRVVTMAGEIAALFTGRGSYDEALLAYAESLTGPNHFSEWWSVAKELRQYYTDAPVLLYPKTGEYGLLRDSTFVVAFGPDWRKRAPPGPQSASVRAAVAAASRGLGTVPTGLDGAAAGAVAAAGESRGIDGAEPGAGTAAGDPQGAVTVSGGGGGGPLALQDGEATATQELALATGPAEPSTVVQDVLRSGV